MRIIAGRAGSIPLLVPRSLTRPTSDRVRESLFAALGDLVADARVLDLFAGSGALGLEALSRGAAQADFVEADAAACDAIAKNLAKTRLSGGRVHQRKVLAYLSTLSPRHYQLIFADPPYARGPKESDLLRDLLQAPALPAALTGGGLFVLESLASVPLPESPLWECREERRYGDTRLSFLVPAEAGPSELAPG